MAGEGSGGWVVGRGLGATQQALEAALRVGRTMPHVCEKMGWHHQPHACSPFAWRAGKGGAGAWAQLSVPSPWQVPAWKAHRAGDCKGHQLPACQERGAHVRGRGRGSVERAQPLHGCWQHEHDELLMHGSMAEGSMPAAGGCSGFAALMVGVGKGLCCLPCATSLAPPPRPSLQGH